MKSSHLKIAQLACLTSLIAILGAGCNGGLSTRLVVVTNPPPPIVVCPAWGCGGPPVVIIGFGASGGSSGGSTGSSGSSGDSIETGTRDTDLQQADLQSATLATRAQTLSAQFQMSLSAATQLAVLGDKVQMMTSQGQALSDEDRDAITQSALSIAGVSSDEVNQAFQQSATGDNSATDALLEKAAQNLGMSSSDSLRNQLLPALGVQF
jgi:hypothetical protein